MLDRMQQFSKEEMGKIHTSSMQILKEMGVIFQAAEALTIFKNHGFKIDGQTVFFDEEQVMNALKRDVLQINSVQSA